MGKANLSSHWFLVHTCISVFHSFKTKEAIKHLKSKLDNLTSNLSGIKARVFHISIKSLTGDVVIVFGYLES